MPGYGGPPGCSGERHTFQLPLVVPVFISTTENWVFLTVNTLFYCKMDVIPAQAHTPRANTIKPLVRDRSPPGRPLCHPTSCLHRK